MVIIQVKGCFFQQWPTGNKMGNERGYSLSDVYLLDSDKQQVKNKKTNKKLSSNTYVKIITILGDNVFTFRLILTIFYVDSIHSLFLNERKRDSYKR